MPIEHPHIKPGSGIEIHCLAASVCFDIAALKTRAAADDAPLHSPERALLERRFALWSGLGAELRSLGFDEARELRGNTTIPASITSGKERS